VVDPLRGQRDDGRDRQRGDVGEPRHRRDHGGEDDGGAAGVQDPDREEPQRGQPRSHLARVAPDQPAGDRERRHHHRRRRRPQPGRVRRQRPDGVVGDEHEQDREGDDPDERRGEQQVPEDDADGPADPSEPVGLLRGGGLLGCRPAAGRLGGRPGPGHQCHTSGGYPLISGTPPGNVAPGGR
jgi:hypothetical protein